jgi:hypothetical protein
MFQKGGRFRAAFFLCRQTLLSYRTSESSVFSIQGVGGVPGGPRGPPGGPRGGRGGPGGPKKKIIEIYEDPKRPHNSGFWIGMTPRDDREAQYEDFPSSPLGGAPPIGGRGLEAGPGGPPRGGPRVRPVIEPRL